MFADTDIAASACLLGDPTRAQMMIALFDGRARSAGELARGAGVAPATASRHLGLLLDAGLLTMRVEGRHRFYALAGHDVAAAMEALAAISPTRPVRNLRQGIVGEKLRRARTCYDHLAGVLGVALADALVSQGVIEPLTAGSVGTLRDPAHPMLVTLGVPVPVVSSPTRRPMVRGCLDWSERRPHAAGHLGAAILAALTERGDLKRRSRDRALELTSDGIDRLSEALEFDRALLAT